MTTKQQVRKLCKELGVTLDDDRFELLAPDYWRFKSNFCHSIVFEPQLEDYVPGTRPHRSPNKKEVEDAWEDALHQLGYGLEPCPMDCECRDEHLEKDA